MKANGKQIDWLGFAVHCAFGAVFGAGIGLWVFSESDWASSPSGLPALAMAAGGALVCGLIAGVFKDGFWDEIISRHTDFQWFEIKLAGVLLVLAVLVLGIFRMMK